MAPSRYPHLDWQEYSPGLWEREIDEAERFYTCLAKLHEGTGRMFFALTGFVSLSVSIPKGSSLMETGHLVEEALRIAWLRLRYDHPTIASSVGYNTELDMWVKSYVSFYSDMVAEQTEIWLRATFLPTISQVSGLEWCNNDPPTPKYPTLFVLTPPHLEGDDELSVRRDLIIRSPHDIMDGIGTLQFLNNLAAYAAQAFEQPSSWSPPPPGSESQNLSPPLRVAAAIPPILTLNQQERLQNIIAFNALLRQNVNILAIPFKKGATVPGKHQRIAYDLSPSDTTQILEACTQLGVTVTHVYHTAVTISIRDMQESGLEKRSTRYISYSLFNERPKCTGEYSTSKHAATVYHSVSGQNLALDLVIPSVVEKERGDVTRSKEEFYSLLEQVKDYYHTIRTSPDNLALAPYFWSMATPHITNPTSAPHERPIPAPNASPSVSISSLGVVDKIISPQHGPFKISNPWVTGEELGTGLGVFLSTWEGKLQLSAAYNEAWHDEDEVETFLKHCQEVVCKGLGLDDQMSKTG